MNFLFCSCSYNIHTFISGNGVGLAFFVIDFAIGEIVNVRHKATKFAFPIFFVDFEFAETCAKTRFLRTYFHEEIVQSLPFASRGEKTTSQYYRKKKKNGFIGLECARAKLVAWSPKVVEMYLITHHSNVVKSMYQSITYV